MASDDQGQGMSQIEQAGTAGEAATLALALALAPRLPGHSPTEEGGERRLQLL